MKIILGSNNKDKVEILKKALEQLHLDVEVEGAKVESGITDQPLDKEITLKGSQNRARNARKEKPDADFCFGLEGGLHDYGEGYHLVTYATLIDKSGDEYIGEGVEIHLPESVSDEVKSGGWFGDAIRIYAKEHEIDENLISRDTPFTEATQRAYANYIIETTASTYRKKALGVVFRESDKKFLIIQKPHYNEADWDFPGGGIDNGESAEDALLRELGEELGTNKFEIVEKSPIEKSYSFPDYLVVRWLKNKESLRCKGQTQLQYIVRFTGENSDIKIDDKEISKYIWVSYEELFDHMNMTGQEENIKEVIETSSLEL